MKTGNLYEGGSVIRENQSWQLSRVMTDDGLGDLILSGNSAILSLLVFSLTIWLKVELISD